MSSDPGVVVIGGGPAGLSAAAALARAGVGPVLVIERERQAGGIPRHAAHQGFGVRDLRRLLSGPRYAERLAAAARTAGAEIMTETAVTGWASPGALELTGPDGRRALRPEAVLLATGCRERPRSARLVPGTRPQGVLTTGSLQQLVHLQHLRPGRRAVIVGAEHVSYSAISTLRDGGCRVLGMVTELPRHQSLAAFALGASVGLRVPLWTRTRVSAIHGRGRVQAVELTDLATGTTRTLACDTVVFSADWIPDHELAVLAGAELDPLTRGPAVDSGLRTSLAGLYAAGNLVQGAETADLAALSGRHAAAAIAADLAAGLAAGGSAAPRRRVPIRCQPPLGWVSPNVAGETSDPPLRGHLALRAFQFMRLARVIVEQDGRGLWRGRLERLMPGRSARLPAGWLSAVDRDGGPVWIRPG